MIEHYTCQRIGAVPLRRLRVCHLDQLYADLLDHGGLTGAALASKTVYDVHLIVRSALADATRRQLLDVNVALLAQAPRSQPRARRRTRDMDCDPAASLPRQRPPSAALPGAASGRHDRDATRRARRAALE